MSKWFIAFGALCIITLIAIQVCNTVGVGQAWPFAVIVPLFLATVGIGVVACTRGNIR